MPLPEPQAGGTASSLPNASDVDAALARVLARPDYREPPPDALAPLREWLDAQLKALWEWLGGIFELDAAVVGRTGETLLWVAAIAAAAVVVQTVIRALRRRAGDDAADVRPSASAVAGERTLAAQLAAAAAAAAAGSFLVAAHALYLAVLLWLDQVGDVRYADDKTGGDYARELRGRARSVFTALLGAFYPVAYGGRAEAAEAYTSMRRLASELGVPER